MSTADARVYEYSSSANPPMPQVPVVVHRAALHQSGSSRVEYFDLSKQLGMEYPCSSPNLLAAFVRVCAEESLSTSAVATSSCFYVINGSGSSSWGTPEQTVSWAQGDLFTVPGAQAVLHAASSDAALYYVSDAPLLSYLGVVPSVHRFKPTHFTSALLKSSVEALAAKGGRHSNRVRAVPPALSVRHF